MPVAEMGTAEGREQDSGKEPSVPIWKCYIWEIREPVVTQPGTVSSFLGPALNAKWPDSKIA